MSALTSTERREFDALEAVVQAGLATFIDVGRALAEIRDRRLYRSTHRTFEEYCHERWLLRRTRAYQLIDAAVVSTIVDSDPPSNEAQARELAPLKDDEAEVVAAWREAKAEAEDLGTSLTAKIVRNAAQKRLRPLKRERKHGELRERHSNSRCDGCGRTPQEIEDAGVPMSSAWIWSGRNSVRTHLCFECNSERLRKERERRAREERELAERLGEEGYRQLQEERARAERRADASKELRFRAEHAHLGRTRPRGEFPSRSCSLARFVAGTGPRRSRPGGAPGGRDCRRRGRAPVCGDSFVAGGIRATRPRSDAAGGLEPAA